MSDRQEKIECNLKGFKDNANPFVYEYWLGTLSGRERLILNHASSNTLKAMGDMMNISGARYRQIEMRFLRRISTINGLRGIETMARVRLPLLQKHLTALRADYPSPQKRF